MLHQIPNYTAATAVYPYTEGLDASLTFISKYGDQVKMGVKENDTLLVPRRLAMSLGKDLRTENFLGAIDCKAGPRDEEQADCINQSLALLQQGEDHVIEAPTGFGKTYLGCAIAAALGQTTCIVVPKGDLMDSWRDTLIQLIGVPFDQIGIAKADKLDYKGKRFVIASVQSLIRPGKYDSDFFSYFGLVIFDETHRMCAKSFSLACTKFPGKYRLGLSATPKRGDGKTPVVTAHIGHVKVKGTIVPMKPKILVKQTGWRVPSWMSRIDPGRMMGVYVAMGKSQQRNALIVKYIKDAFAADRTCVVMGDTIDHLKALFMMCGQVGLPGEHMGMYIADTCKTKEQRQFNGNKRIIFATYGMCAEGTDFPAWDTLIMVTPRKNIKQPLGRILRKKKDKKEPVCIDLIDNGSIFQGFFNGRRTQYFEVGATIKYMDAA